jgi:hypothetical protein
MAYDGTVGGVIPLTTAAEWTANYRATGGTSETLTIAQYFGEKIILSILAQDGCFGIRFYYAIDGSGNDTLIMVGVDASGNDLVDGIVADFSLPCPASCSNANALNSAS